MNKHGSILLSATLLLLAACGEKVATAQPAPAPAAPAPAPAATEKADPEPDPFEVIQVLPDLKMAMEVAKPLMKDTFDEASLGTALLTSWAVKRMRWEMIGLPQNETTVQRVMKDSEEEMGKRMCKSGRMVQISVSRTPVGKIAEGLLYSGNDLIHFATVGSSGDLVQSSPARLCGVVTGIYNYSNSAGGTGHAVELVGMFDLPENH